MAAGDGWASLHRGFLAFEHIRTRKQSILENFKKKPKKATKFSDFQRKCKFFKNRKNFLKIVKIFEKTAKIDSAILRKTPKTGILLKSYG